jgi:hypothetical protein
VRIITRRFDLIIIPLDLCHRIGILLRIGNKRWCINKYFPPFAIYSDIKWWIKKTRRGLDG